MPDVLTLPKPFYQDASVTLYNCDCRELLPSLGRFDVLLTDPPFGLGNRGWAGIPSKWQKLAGVKPTRWDDETPDLETIQAMVDMCETSIIWGGNYFGLKPSRCWLSWHKPDAVPKMSNIEHAWTSMDRNSRMMSYTIAATNPERVGHPTQKPLAVMRWCLSMVSGETILDPYAGSGTTLLAAKLDGKKAVGIEANPDYCEKIVKRLKVGVLF